MAQGKKPPKRKKGRGLIGTLIAINREIDRSAGWMAKLLEPKPAKARRASVEWTSRAGGNGERLPLQVQRGLAWGKRLTEADKEWWRVSFIAGPTVEFLTWPPRDHTEACQLAQEHVVKKYSVYAASWEIGVVEFVRKAVEDELSEDAKA